MRKTLTFLICLGCVTVAIPTQAVPILLGQTNLGNSGDATEAAYLQGLVGSSPELQDLDFSKTSVSDGGQSFDFVMPEGVEFVYLLLKWGGGRNNPYSHQAFYVTEDSTFASPVYVHQNKEKQGGLSHWDTWSGTINVPEGGSTALLLGVGLAALLMGFKRWGSQS